MAILTLALLTVAILTKALGRMAGVVTLGCGMRVRPQGDLVAPPPPYSTSASWPLSFPFASFERLELAHQLELRVPLTVELNLQRIQEEKNLLKISRKLDHA